MTELICEYCDFRTKKKGTLNKHQKTAKYCLKKQQEISDKEQKETEKLTCKHCNKILSRADSLIRHQQTCVEYLLFQKEESHKREIENLKEIIAEKNKQLAEKDQYIWRLTNMSIDKNKTSISIDTVNVHTDVKTVEEMVTPLTQLALEH